MGGRVNCWSLFGPAACAHLNIKCQNNGSDDSNII